MIDSLSSIKLGNVGVPFDYKPVHYNWVTDPAIGQKLAKTLVCYSLLYRHHPIVVAHSMGGLAAREALDWAAYGKRVKDVVDFAVTIAAPNTGTALANLDNEFWVSACKAPVWMVTPWVDESCRQARANEATSGLSINSDQLVKLAKFPPNVSVKAIAGNVIWKVCAPWGCSSGVPMGGDLVVSVGSALDQATNRGRGDGRTVFDCEATDVPISGRTTAWCEHGNLLRAPQVQQEVKRSIEAFIASDSQKPSTGPTVASVETVTFFDQMSLRLPQTATAMGAHGEGPSSYEVSCLSAAECPRFSVYSPTEVGGIEALGWKDWPLPQCSNPAASVPGAIVAKGSQLVGSKSAQYYEAELCGPGVPHETDRFWVVEDGTILIMSTNTDQTRPVMDSIIDSAAWK